MAEQVPIGRFAIKGQVVQKINGQSPNEDGEITISTGPGGGPANMDDITDAQPVGKAVVRAASATAAREAMGAASTAQVEAVAATSGGYLNTVFLKAALVPGENARPAMTAVIAQATALAQDGTRVIVDLPAGVFPITTALGASVPKDSDVGGNYPTQMGFALPVNLPGTIEFRGRGSNATVFQFTANCKNALFFVGSHVNYDVIQNLRFTGFSVDNNGQVGRGHVIFGTQPEHSTPQKYLSVFNVHASDVKVIGAVPFDHNLTATNKAPFVFRHRHLGGYEAGTTPGSLPLNPFPGRAGAAAAKWTYSIDMTFTDVDAGTCQRGILVVCDITQNTSHWMDRIRYERVRHEQPSPYVTSATQTSFYIGGNCQGGRADIIDATSINVGDDSIEFGGLQELYVRNLITTNPVLDAILIRYSQPPADASQVRILIEGVKHTITAAAIGNDMVDNPENPGNSVRRSHRGRTWEIKMENDAAALTLGNVKITDVAFTIEGGFWRSLNRSSLLGFVHTGPVRNMVIERVRCVLRNFKLDYGTGTYITDMFIVRPSGGDGSGNMRAVVRDCEVVIDTLTTDGARFEIYGSNPSGLGSVLVDGFRMTMVGCPSTVVVRAALSTPGRKQNADAAALTAKRIEVRRHSGVVSGSGPSELRGVQLGVAGEDDFDLLVVDDNDFRGFASTIDYDHKSNPISSKVMFGGNNLYQRFAGGGHRAPTAVDYSMRAFDGLVAVTSTSAARTVTLPSLATVMPGRRFQIFDESGGAGANAITVVRSGTDLFSDGATSKQITANYGSLAVYSNGTAWVLIASDIAGLIVGALSRLAYLEANAIYATRYIPGTGYRMMDGSAVKTDADKVRFALSQPDEGAPAPTGFNSHDAWFRYHAEV